MTALVVVLLLLVAAGFVFAGLGGAALFVSTERSRRKAEERASELLDQAFDGRDQVTYKVNLETPSYETVVRGAQERGYRLTHETNDTSNGVAKTLLFDRR